MDKNIHKYIDGAVKHLGLSLTELLERQDKKIADNLKYINRTNNKDKKDFGIGYAKRKKLRETQINYMHNAILWRMEVKKEIEFRIEKNIKPI